jgi:aspartate/methionine/tyrosine aminotransferase
VVGLIEPTFDNIPDILKRRGVPLQAISVAASGGYASNVLAAIRTRPGQAIFIVSPNNPTGEYLSVEEFTEIAMTCAALRCVLILDASFRLFEPEAMFDQHSILAAAGTDYVIIEDTGKYWPSLDLKLSYIFASPALRTTLQSIHEDILLNVSPFVSLLVSRFAKMSAADGLRSVREPIAANRRALRDFLAIHLQACTTPFADSRVSVELVRLPDGWRADHLTRRLESNGLAVLPGNLFFWNAPMRGNAYIRIALARSPADFGAALRALDGATRDALRHVPA